MLRRATKHEKNDARFRFAKGICQRSSVGYRRVATAIHQLRKAKSECAQSTDSQPLATQQPITQLGTKVIE